MELLESLSLDLQGIKLESFTNLLVHLKIIAPMIDGGYFMPTILPPCDKNINFPVENQLRLHLTKNVYVTQLNLF